MKRPQFINGYYYHVFNRGVDKRRIFSDEQDTTRFLQSLSEFNVTDSIGSIYESSFSNNKSLNQTKEKPLVHIICYCLNTNHFHLILKQVQNNGISNFMQRVGTGYTNYFNNRHKRSGSLFQGVFKATPIKTDEQLYQMSVYVNLNDRVHQLGSFASKLVKSSWENFVDTSKRADNHCPELQKNSVLSQFSSAGTYKTFALETLPLLLERKREEKELAQLIIE